MLTEFKEFAVKGNVIDLAVGVIIGAAFGKIVDSVVGDLIMPVVGAIFGKRQAIANLHHIGIIPMVWTSVLAQSVLHIEYFHHAPGEPGPMIVLAIPAGVNITRGTPQVTNVFRPFPGFIGPPFAHTEHDRAFCAV